jgi:hypothetical protein
MSNVLNTLDNRQTVASATGTKYVERMRWGMEQSKNPLYQLGVSCEHFSSYSISAQGEIWVLAPLTTLMHINPAK